MYLRKLLRILSEGANVCRDSTGMTGININVKGRRQPSSNCTQRCPHSAVVYFTVCCKCNIVQSDVLYEKDTRRMLIKTFIIFLFLLGFPIFAL